MDCLDDQLDHDPKKNVSKHTQHSIKEIILAIINEIKPKNEYQVEFVQELKEIIRHQKKASKSDLKIIF